MAAAVMAAVGISGIYLTLISRGFALRALPRACAGIFSARSDRRDGIPPIQAVCTALAAAMGTGNVAGVATALTAGGPGAIFWMWIFALFGTTTKYTEIALAVRYRQKNADGRWQGGPMYYLRDGVGSPLLAGIFALCCAAASFGIGNMAQVNSLSAAMAQCGIAAPLCGLCCAAICVAVIFGGIERIGAVCETLVPVMSALYLAGCCIVLALRWQALPEALGLILRCAFGGRAVLGGAAGWSFGRAVSIGAARGIFSNEAGLGSAPIAHASAACADAGTQGLFGIFEVFADTLVMCTLTALVLLTAPNRLWLGGETGAALTAQAFAGALGGAGYALVAAAMVCFGVSSLLGWAHYGETAIRYLFPGNTAAAIYRVGYTAAAAFAALLPTAAVWALSDLLNAAMALPNICGVLLLCGRVLPVKKRRKRFT